MSRDSTLAAGTHVGPYTVQRSLGRGGFGEVYEVLDERSNAHRALKLLGEAQLDELQRELDRLSLITEHRATVVRVYDRGAHGRRPWFAMDLLRGETLEQRAARAPLTLSAAVPLFADIARVLDEAHAHEIIHRDIKPSNIFLDRGPNATEDRVVVLDFGVAALTEHTPSTRSIVVSQGYSPPEQFEGRKAAPTMDVYSFAASLLFALTGLAPNHEAFDPSAVERAAAGELSSLIARRNGERITALDPWFASALARDPRDRPQTIRDAMRSLLEATRTAAPRAAASRKVTAATQVEPRAVIEDVPENKFFRAYDLTVAREQRSRREPAPHQLDAMDKLQRWFAAHQKDAGAVVVLPTGGGKTFTAVRFLCAGPLSDGFKVLWLAHTHHLLEQAADAFGAPGATSTEVGWIQGEREQLRLRVVSGTPGHSKVQHIAPDDDVLVCTLQAMSNAVQERQRNVERFIESARGRLVVVFDEAHHAPAPSYARLIETLRARAPSTRTIGLTATPISGNEQREAWMRRLFPQWVIYQIATQKLMAAGVLAKPTIEEHETGRKFTIDAAAERALRRTNSDLPEEIITKLAEDQQRNDFIVQTYLKDRSRYGRTIIFADRWFQCEYLAKKLSDAGVRTDVVYSHVEVGPSSAEARRRRTRDENAKAIERFRRGTIDVLVNVRILTEGTDVPSTESVFLTRQTTSPILLTQMVGRALRGPAFGGTAKANIVSFIDDWQSLVQWADLAQIGVGDALPLETKRREHRPLRLVSIALVRRLIDMMQSSRPAASPFRTIVPLGWYATNFASGVGDGDVELVAPLVMVYEDEAPAFEQLVAHLARSPKDRAPFEPSELDFETVERPLAALIERYFKDRLGHTGAVLEDDVLRVARHIAQNEGTPPRFFRFEQREQHNLDVIVQRSVDERWGALDVDARLRELWEDPALMWKVLIPDFELFYDQFVRQQRRVVIARQTRHDPSAFRAVFTPVQTPELQPEQGPNADVRKSVIARDNFRCLACGSADRRQLQVDHIVPQFHGGDSSIDNLQTLCRYCNRLKSITSASYRHSTTRLTQAPQFDLVGMLPDKDAEMTTELFEQCVRRIVNGFYQCAAVDAVKITLRGLGRREWHVTLRPGNDPRWLSSHLDEILGALREFQQRFRSEPMVRRIIVRSAGSDEFFVANSNEAFEHDLAEVKRFITGHDYVLYWPENIALPNEPTQVELVSTDRRANTASVLLGSKQLDDVPLSALWRSDN
jgi:superfamily II DNA or RNA helicase/5-methylcytosine-specific restriction endonuclease McrA